MIGAPVSHIHYRPIISISQIIYYILNMIKKILTFLLIFMIHFVFAQSPWLQNKRTLLTQLSINIIPEYHQLFLNSGNTYYTERNLNDNTLQGWFEYGISDHAALQMILPIKFMKAGPLVESHTTTPHTSSGSLQAFGNISLIWKQKLLHQAWILTSNLIMEFPTAFYQDDSGLRSGYDAWSISVALSTGRGFGRAYFYTHLGIGARSNNYSSFFTGGFEGGYQLSQHFWVAGVVSILQSFLNGSRQDPVNNLLTGLYVNNQEFIAWGLKLFGPIIPDRFGYSLSIFSAACGNFVAKSAPINLGLYYIFTL